ncbi:MAG: DUF4149 domain-containing protein [Myxococcota bacterium]
MTRPGRLALALVALWLGAMIMMSTAATAVFGVVPPGQGGEIMRRIFPVYYAGSLAVPVLALALALPGARRRRAGIAGLATLGLAFAVAAWNALVVRPRLADLRQAMHTPEGLGDPALAEAFGRLHVQSVSLLSALMLLALVFICLEILARPRPGAAGN